MYVCEKFIVISPVVICELLGLSHHDLNANHTYLLKVKSSKIAKVIYAAKGNTFRHELSLAHLNLK